MNIRRKIRTILDTWHRVGWGGLRNSFRYKIISWQQTRAYKKWMRAFDAISDKERERIGDEMSKLGRLPLISVILPVFNVEEKWLRLAIDSVRQQIYKDWELCIADDCSKFPHVSEVLKEYSTQDDRIKVVFRSENGHISAASNSALELVTGEYTVLLDHDDELSEDALFYVAKEINEYPEAGLIYSDEDLISKGGRRFGPKFKPDFSRDLFYSGNLVTHLSAYKTDLLRRVGGFTVGLEGSQDYDLALRVLEEIPERQIRHIPRILYHWRVLETSVSAEGDAKPYAYENARRAIGSHLERTGKKADVLETVHKLNRVRYHIPEKKPLVSLVTNFRGSDRNAFEEVSRIAAKTDYDNFEIVGISDTEDSAKRRDRIRDANGRKVPFEILSPTSASEAENLNRGVSRADGDVICFLDHTLLPDSGDWLEELVRFAVQEEIGAVGAKLLYPNGAILQGGLLIGVGGTVGVAHYGRPAEDDGHITRTRLIGNYSAVSSQCMAIRRDLFLKAGGFAAERYPNDLYDADLCLRVREMGKRIVWTPYSQLWAADYKLDDRRYITPSTREKDNFDRDWKQYMASDPFYNPNLSRKSANFLIEA